MGREVLTVPGPSAMGKRIPLGQSALETAAGGVMGRGWGREPFRRRQVMGIKAVSVWTLLAALVGGPVMAQDDAGWAKTSPRALPPADPDEGLEILVPAPPAVPPVPPIPAESGDVPAPRVVQAGVLPADAPVTEMLAPRWNGLSAGVGFSILRPYVNNNPAFTVVNPPAASTFAGAPLLSAANRTVSFDWDSDAAVQFWVAYDDPSGFGARVRAFVFDTESPILGARLGGGGTLPTVTAPLIPGLPAFGAPSPVLLAAHLGADHLTFTSDLRIVSTDFEGTYGWMGDDCSVQVSAGLRYQLLRQGFTATLANPGDGLTFIAEELRVQREFEGCGPTASVFARQRICESPFAVYAGARASVLLGTVDTCAGLTQVINDPTGAAGVGTSRTRTGFSSRADSTLAVTELELGVEYGKLVGHYGLFVRAGVVAQTYFDAGGAALPLGSLSLFGGQLSVGVAY
jgi:hypothetical protein